MDHTILFIDLASVFWHTFPIEKLPEMPTSLMYRYQSRTNKTLDLFFKQKLRAKIRLCFKQLYVHQHKNFHIQALEV